MIRVVVALGSPADVAEVVRRWIEQKWATQFLSSAVQVAARCTPIIASKKYDIAL